MNPDDLRAVETVDLNEVWNHEEHDFTPWLVEHIDVLGQTVGIEFDEVTREDSVGGYKADITATELNTGGRVVVENQFGQTDHNHLGQLLTYAAGTDAQFVIWLAESFRDEHRSVLEWMNQNNAGETMFFAIQPRVVQLEGGEEIGFEFDVMVEPNDWEIEVSGELSSREQAYKQFFSELTADYADRNPKWNRLKAQPQSWLGFGAGISGIRFTWSFHQGPELGVELYIDTGGGDRNEEILDHLEPTRAEFEEQFGAVSWERLPDKRACRIKIPRQLEADIEGMSAMQKREVVEWAAQTMDDFRAILEPRLKEISR